MLMSLGDRFNIIEIDRLLKLPKMHAYQWAEFYIVKEKRAEEARERAKNEAKNRRS